MRGAVGVKVTRAEKVEPERDGRTEGRRDGGRGCMGEGLHGSSHSCRNAGVYALEQVRVGFFFSYFLEAD